jgi:hypothetical protein
LFALASSCFAYVILNIDYLLGRLFLVDPIRPADYFFGTCAFILIWEASRRTINTALPLISAFFIVYTYFGSYFPGQLAHKGATFERIIDHQFMTTDGIFTLPIGVFSVFIFLFVLFGSFLDRMGAADFYVKLSIAAAGRLRGGPAKAAIFASGMTGSITGSVNANVATTGPFTIPLMKKTGFKPETASKRLHRPAGRLCRRSWAFQHFSLLSLPASPIGKWSRYRFYRLYSIFSPFIPMFTSKRVRRMSLACRLTKCPQRGRSLKKVGIICCHLS